MRLDILNIPDDTHAIAKWIDQHLVSPDLIDLVTDLSAIHRVEVKTSSIEDAEKWLGNQYESFLKKGCEVFDEKHLQEILQSPHLLLSLQELILSEESSFYTFESDADLIPVDSKPAAAKRLAWGGIVAASLAASLFAMLSDQFVRKPSKKINSVPNGAATLLRGGRSEQSQEIVPRKSSAGWNDPSLITKVNGSTNPVSVLATYLNKWFDSPVDTEGQSQETLVRVAELWAGCERVRNANIQFRSSTESRKVLLVVEDLSASLVMILDDTENFSGDIKRTGEVIESVNKIVKDAVGRLGSIAKQDAQNN